jgi:hypothetical protein
MLKALNSVRELNLSKGMARSLLLDIDGVVIRDRLLLQHVKQNCVEYVRAKLPACKDPALLNKHLYLAHGHTARGLELLFKADVSDFNEKVYDARLLGHLSEFIYSEKFQKDAKDIHEVTERGWDVTLFTNSPIEWAGPVARAIGDKVSLKCPGPDVSKSHLKPEMGMYNFPNDQEYIFVDDSLKNLGAVRSLPNWHPIYFYETDKDSHLWCPQVGSICELNNILRLV